MGISKMPLRRFRQREGRIFDNEHSSDDEDIERDWQSAFEMLSQVEQERAQKKLKDYLQSLNNEDELLEEQNLLQQNANLIGGKLKTSDLQSLIAHKEKEHLHKTHSIDDEEYDDLNDFGYPPEPEEKKVSEPHD